MSRSRPEERRQIVYVCRHPAGEALRGARAISELDGVTLFCICERPPRGDVNGIFADLVRVEDVHDTRQLIAAARGLVEKHGLLAQVVTAQETLLEPLARVTEALKLGRGLSVAAVQRALDKSCLKRTLARAGVKTARDCLITSDADARRFAAEVGFPIVLKPLTGSGGLATWRVRDDDQLAAALRLMRPSPVRAVLAEVYLCGEELCLDTITIANEPRFFSICLYRPSILEALETPRVQWMCLMPRDIAGERYREFIAQGLAAVRALAVGDAMTHMEGFLLAGGSYSFTDATLRPAGARIAPMLAFAYDMDPHRAWARAVVDGCFDGPWERKYAVGTVFLRGMGRGLVEHIDGIEAVKRQVGELVVDARWPQVGAAKSATYTGDGYVTVRHPETDVVEDALRFIAESARVVYTEPEPHADEATGAEWSQRIHHFDKQLNKPVWEDD